MFLAVEAELKAQGERRGRPKSGDEDISQNFGELFGKKNYEVAADKAGFGNAETYRQAKTVVQKTSPELKAQGERRGGDTSSGEQRNPVNSPECSGKETREIAADKRASAVFHPAHTGAAMWCIVGIILCAISCASA